MTWIYAIPMWWMLIFTVVAASLLACAALAFTRTRLMRNDQITHNDVAGAMFSTMGTLLAVIVAFMVIGVWEEHDQAGQTVANEAGAASDIAHLSYVLPQADEREIVHEVQSYLRIVIDKEFPLMQSGQDSPAAHEAADRLEETLARFVPHSSAQAAIQAKELDYVGRLKDARRIRIFDELAGIPIILWAVMLFTGFLVIAFAFYFRVDRPRAHYIMVAALAALIASIYVVIAELDYPFRGDISISSADLQRVHQTIQRDTGIP